MKKTTVKRLLALVVGALIIAASLTAGFGAFAAAPADSEADYYDVDGKGIKATLIEWPYHLKPVDTLGNLDFEDGYRYWSGGKGKGTYAKEVFDIVTENGNSYAKIPAAGYVSNFQSALFKLDGVVAGDEIVVVYDVKGADGTKLRVKIEQEFVKDIAVYDETTGIVTTTKADGVSLINVTPGMPSVLVGSGGEQAEFDAQLGAEGWTTILGVSDNKLLDPTTSPAAGGTSDPIKDAFYIRLTITGGDTGVATGNVIDAAIDNIRICKVTGDEENKVYTDLATSTVIYPEPEAPKYPAYFGTEADGLDSNLTHFPMQLTPADDIYNLDFSDGFIFWGGKALAGAGDVASSAFDIVTEGDNKYAKVKEDGYVSNISTALFTAKNVQAGDNLVVLYDVKGKDGFKLRIKLVQEFLKEIAVYDKDTGLNTTLKSDGATLINCCPGIPAVPVGSSVENAEFSIQTEAEGWTTLIAETGHSVLDPKSSPAAADTSDTIRDEIFLQVVVTCTDAGVQPGDIVDAAIDNIRICKVVDDQYIDVVTNEVISAEGGAGEGGEGGTGSNSPTSGDSVLALAALFFVSGAAVFGTAKAMKNR